jgi:hypothetical protein
MIRICGCGARLAKRARLSASHHGSCQGALAPFAQLQASLPGTRPLDAFAGRALPAPACPSPGKAPPAPAVVPQHMMPGAAPARLRARAEAPISLHAPDRIRSVPFSMSEIRRPNVADLGTIVKNRLYIGDAPDLINATRSAPPVQVAFAAIAEDYAHRALRLSPEAALRNTLSRRSPARRQSPTSTPARTPG